MRTFFVVCALLGTVFYADAATSAGPLTHSNLLWWSTNITDGADLSFDAGQCTMTNYTRSGSSWYAGVLWTNAVTLRFASGSTITNRTTTATNTTYYVFRFASTSAPASRITGLTIDGGRGRAGIIVGAGTYLRADHCTYQNCYGRGVMFWGLSAYGVVDHCTFTNNRIAFEADGSNNASWAQDEACHTTNSVTVEDCTIYNDANSVPIDIVVYTGQGSRTAFRHSTLILNTPDNEETWDSHGNLAWLPADNRGAVFSLIADNSISISNSYRDFYFRGGTVLMISNTITSVDSGGIQLTEEEGWNTSFFDPVLTEWPAQDSITNSWFVGNTWNGSALTASQITNRFGHASDLVFIQEGRDFVVTNAMPPSSIYTPLAYPHPLVTFYDTRRTHINKLIVR